MLLQRAAWSKKGKAVTVADWMRKLYFVSFSFIFLRLAASFAAFSTLVASSNLLGCKLASHSQRIFIFYAFSLGQI
jgi:hypothetical protein